MWRFARTAAAVLLIAAQAKAQTAQDLETARELFREATELHDARDLKGSLAKFKAAHVLANTPVTGIELARNYVELGMLTEAREVALAIDKIPVKPNESAKTKTARTDAVALAASLYPRIPALTIIVDNVPAGATPAVTIDNDALPEAALGSAIRLNPGAHAIVASVGGGPPSTTSVSLNEGETRTIHVTVEPPPPPPKPDPTPVPAPQPQPEPPPVTQPEPAPVLVLPKKRSDSSGTLFGVAGLSFAIGGGAAAVGALFGGLALAFKDDVNGKCNAFKQCDSSGLRAVSTTKTFATTSTVFFVAGGIFVGGAIVLAIIGAVVRPKEETTSARFFVAPTQGGMAVGASGSF